MAPPHSHHHFARTEFERQIDQYHPDVRRTASISTLMLNVGLRCNLACQLCHHACSPERTETMSRGVMLDTAHLASELRPELIDITGGEPTLWPLLREFVAVARGTSERMRVWTNLDALLLPENDALPAFLADNDVEVLASLPEALECRTIGGCVEALRRLAEVGYGDPALGAKVALDVAYNPLPPALPRPADELAEEFREALGPHGIRFRRLVAIANVPLGGFAEWLEANNETEQYRAVVRAAFNPDTLPCLPCRSTLEIAWDGTLWDCDFNLAARVGLTEGANHVSDYVGSPVGQLALATRRIAFADHCFVCAAGAGTGWGR